MSKHTAAEVLEQAGCLPCTGTGLPKVAAMLRAYADLLTEVNEALAVIEGPSSIKEALSIFHDEHCQLHDLLAEQEKAEPCGKITDRGNYSGSTSDAPFDVYRHPPAPAWMPIESAPKDGSCFLACCGNWVTVAHWHRVQLCWATNGPNYSRYPHDEQPTHWQPLPPAPKGE